MQNYSDYLGKDIKFTILYICNTMLYTYYAFFCIYGNLHLEVNFNLIYFEFTV